jgi:Uncharacterized conserved protein
MKIIYHINNNKNWMEALINIKNMVEYYHEHQIEYEIDVVADHDAIKEYQNPHLLIKDLFLKDVRFIACHQSLKENHVEMKDIEDFICVVSLGVVEIALRQSAGFQYIKV